MSERLVCDRCGITYCDKESIDSAKKMAQSWKESCRKDGVEARGIAPCPIIECKGELQLKT